jgi:hypothetical protein
MKSLTKIKKQKKTKLKSLLKKNNTSRNRFQKKTNKKYYNQFGGSIETAKKYFFKNYIATENPIRDDQKLRTYITENLQSIISAKEQEFEALQEAHTKNVQNIDKQIQKLTDDTIKAKKLIIKRDNIAKFNETSGAMKQIIENLKIGEIETIFEDSALLFECIITYLKSIDSKYIEYIDLFIKFYLNGSMGNPNSIENYGRLVDSVKDFEILKAHNMFTQKPENSNSNNYKEDEDKNINKFEGLTGDGDDYTFLESFLSKPKYSKFLDENKQSKIDADEAKKGATVIGEINNDNGSIKVYWLRTEAAAKFYGQKTKWCTAATEKNMFNEYNKQDRIYLINIKKGAQNVERYQLHALQSQFMNVRNEYANIDNFMDCVNEIDKEKEFTNWFLNTYPPKYSLSIDNTGLVLYTNHTINFINRYTAPKILVEKLTSLEFGNLFNLPLGDSLVNLNLQDLKFGRGFNQPLGDSLVNLTNLQDLKFGRGFNQPLGDSLKNLKELQSLIFGGGFNQPLDNSLENLINLQSLKFGFSFNRQLDNSLENLKNLQSLKFGELFDQPLGYSLNNLTNLQNLEFGYNFNQPLLISLNNLTNLEYLRFGDIFNQPLGNSLKNLTNLQYLRFGGSFDQTLDNSLENLRNLQSLKFEGNFDQLLGNSLKNLTNLQSLTFGDIFDQPLDNSLENLRNLQDLEFGYNFNQPLDNSLENLEKLQDLTFKGQYDHKDNLNSFLRNNPLIKERLKINYME